jgi:glycosyltransferase involved in cell wall biosynthesis
MNRRLHIAHFTNTYHPVISGVVRSVSSFRDALTNLGHNVFIFAQDASDCEDTEPFIFRYPTLALPLPGEFPLAIPFSSFISNVLPILKLDVIHSHHPFLLGQAAARQAQDLDVPLVFTYHTRYREYSHYIALNQELVKDVIDRWLGDYMQQCHHIIAPSESIRHLLVEDYGITEQVTIIPTGIDPEPFQKADGQSLRQERGWANDKVLVSVGRLAPEKNFNTLLQAAALVIEQDPRVRLVLIGDGDEREALEDLAAELEISDRVEFTGKVPFDDVARYLKAADLFCFASVTETQGVVTTEAMAAGLPIVAVDATGTSDVVTHGQEGLLTENNHEALAQSIARVLNDDALRQRLKDGASKKIELFDMKELAQKLVDVYEQARQDKAANRLVNVDKQQHAFRLIDEEQWQRLLGLKREKLPDDV